MQSQKKHLTFPAMLLATIVLLAMLSTCASAPCVQTAGFTRTYQQNTVGGTFVPTQTDVQETFYSYPGIDLYGPYPGAGYAAEYGVGFTPYGYAPYGSLAYL